jgi:plastocyanin
MKLKPRLVILMMVFLLVNLGTIAYGCSEKAETVQKATYSNKLKKVNVDIKLFTFKPSLLEVPVGTTVIWTNGDAIEHSVTHGTPKKLGGAFDSGFFTKGQTFSFTFTEAGEYHYFCKRHNSMQGIIKVIPVP